MPRLRPLLGIASVAALSLLPPHDTRAQGPAAGAAVRSDLAPLDLDAGAQVLVVDRAPDGSAKERQVAAEAALAAGLTILDLREEWTPYIFQEQVGPDGQVLTPRYRSVFLGLATDTTDADGQPLPEGAHNYLEMYGIPPSLKVLRRRFVEDADAMKEGGRCAEVDFDKIRAVRAIPVREPKAQAREQARLRALRLDLEKRRKALRLASVADVVARDPKAAAANEELEKAENNKIAFAEVEKRLECEGLLLLKPPPPAPGQGKKRKKKIVVRHVLGAFDDAMREAVVDFQHKHMLYDAASLRPDTMAALGRAPLDNDYNALVRVLTERVVSAADILEDGTVDGRKSAFYTDASGAEHPVPNQVDAAIKATLEQLALDSADKALAFFQRHQEAELDTLRAGVKLAPPPEYTTPEMDLTVEVDRGDVFYDPLFDENGKENNQSRKHFPMLTLRVRHRGKLVPLVRWRTTIGGWRSDLASNGYEYFRYKGSDVGPRVWRNVVAGPVWIAPNSTPLRTLVKPKTVRGKSQLVVNYDEVGPGYLSAYGLVAAYNVVPGKDGRPDWDNGVRVHGSSEILSIRNPNAYSHGCHRLMNHLAVRLFSYVLRHRHVKIVGDRPLDFSRQFLWKDDVYEMRLPSRGFYFELDPVLPVNVLEGNILGKTKKPITTYVPKPGVKYPPGPMPVPPDSPEARAAGGGGDQ